MNSIFGTETRRRTFHTSVDQLLADLVAWLEDYNQERMYLGDQNQGRGRSSSTWSPPGKLSSSNLRVNEKTPTPWLGSAFLGAVRTGLEPATSGVTGRHSNQLNYRTASLARFTVRGRQIYSRSFGRCKGANH